MYCATCQKIITEDDYNTKMECCNICSRYDEKHLNPFWCREYHRRQVNKYHMVIRNALFGNANKKTQIMFEWLTGKTVVDFKSYIESLFIDDMNWNNNGVWKINGDKVWHIEHIKPSSSFNLLKNEELRKCWNWSNLKPLWAFDNLSKGNKCDEYSKHNFPWYMQTNYNNLIDIDSDINDNDEFNNVQINDNNIIKTRNIIVEEKTTEKE